MGTETKHLEVLYLTIVRRNKQVENTVERIEQYSKYPN